MARIAGIDLPAVKRIEIALTYIFGIGRPKAHSILDRAKIDYGIKVRDLTEDEVSRIRRVITSEETVEGDLRKNISLDIKRLMDISCYRGIRHRKGLPVRGQRTHTNSRTRKGKRRAIAGKKK